MTMSFNDNSGWGYWRHNTYRKTPAQIIYLLVKAIAEGGNILFNVSPDADGCIPGWQMENLAAIGDWVQDHAEAVYGVERSLVMEDINWIQGNSAGVCAEKGNVLYFYLLEWPGQETIIPIVKRDIAKATLLKTGQELAVAKDGLGRLHITGLPAHPVDPYCSVVRLEMR